MYKCLPIPRFTENVAEGSINMLRLTPVWEGTTYQQWLTGTQYPTWPNNSWLYLIRTRYFFRIIGYFGYRVLQKSRFRPWGHFIFHCIYFQDIAHLKMPQLLTFLPLELLNVGYFAPAFKPFTISTTFRQSILKTLKNGKAKHPRNTFQFMEYALTLKKWFW